MLLVHTTLMVAVVGVIFAANNETEIDTTNTTILVEIINSNITFKTMSNIPSSPLKGFNVSGRTNVIDSIIIDANVINTNNSVTKHTDVTEKNDTNGDIPEPLLSDTNTNSTNNNTSLPVIAEANIDGLMTPSQYRFLKTAFKYRLNVSFTCRVFAYYYPVCMVNYPRHDVFISTSLHDYCYKGSEFLKLLISLYFYLHIHTSLRTLL